jgi:pyruvate/2-oxoglutarate dehydrogenase complex dihydrolipoamide dehydrogenase (E3) component
MTTRFVIIGGGPAGHQAATYAARLGAEVTLIEREIIGGAAHLRDCIPSKAMIATGGAFSEARRAATMGLMDLAPQLDFEALRARITHIEESLERSVSELLADQSVRVIRGTGRLVGPHEVVADTADGPVHLEADFILLCTGSRPRIPDWAPIDHKRVLTTRDAYPPDELPQHMIVVGSGVTGVEFVHMFSSFGCKVTLVVSREQVLPQKDPEASAVLEAEFLRRGVKLLKGARAESIAVEDGTVSVKCDDGRVAVGSHALLAIGSIPNSEELGLDAAGVEADKWGYVPINQDCQSNVPHIYAAGDLSGKLPLSSVASMQGRKVAEHIMGVANSATHRHIDYEKAASAIFTEPEIADVGLAEVEAFAIGRKIRVTKVPFAASAKAMILGDPRGFVKLLSDPYTGVVLGGSIVGRGAAELISVVALAVTAHLKVSDILESLFVHPALAESLSEAAE